MENVKNPKPRKANFYFKKRNETKRVGGVTTHHLMFPQIHAKNNL
jgi:hypothetical protein